VQGAGTFNTAIELEQGVALTLGSAQLGTDVQEVVLNGGNNTVNFSGATGSSYLYGAAGNDTLLGGTGNDYLWGGAGSNTFVFQPGWGKDTIMDWTAGTNNMIDLTGLAGAGVHGMADITQSIVNGSDVIGSSHTGTNSITLYGLGNTLTGSSFKFA
jgi:Ca2+-binding RTX toxin-like protein